jgi:hypothetical protein
MMLAAPHLAIHMLMTQDCPGAAVKIFATRDNLRRIARAALSMYKHFANVKETAAFLANCSEQLRNLPERFTLSTHWRLPAW